MSEFDSYEDFMHLKKEDLKEILKTLRLKCSGNKSELCERILMNIEKLDDLREAERLDPSGDTCLPFTIDDFPTDIIGGTNAEALVGLKGKVHVIPVTIDGNTIGLEMFIAVSCKLSRQRNYKSYQTLSADLRFPKEYSSPFADASDHKLAKALIVTHQAGTKRIPANEPMLMQFYSNRQKKEGELQTSGERKALRGIASKMLCYMLIYGVETGLFKMDSTLSLEASGSAPGQSQLELPSYYQSLGFDFGEGERYRPAPVMQARVEELIERCSQAQQ